MSSTTYDEIYNLFLNKINDYFIKKQLETNLSFAKDILLGYLQSAIPKFTYCVKDLDDRDDVVSTFNIKLNSMEKEILSSLMVVEHLTPKIIRDEYLENRLGSKDYSEFSPANQLKQLRELKSEFVSSANTLMLEYYYRQVH